TKCLRILHTPLHVAAYYFNPHYYNEPIFMVNDAHIRLGLYIYMRKLVHNQLERSNISVQLPEFHYVRGLFGNEPAKSSRKIMLAKILKLEFEAVHSDDEWITEEVDENVAKSVEYHFHY
ncbi:hypothetical protein HN51_035917, partial [Arachis hypogaea]